ncbi:MAG: N-acetylmuramoyl-L-alanine amidase [Granulosicoccus sp.]
MLEAASIQHLVVHCSATPNDEPLTVRDIHAMHLGFGWHGVGYHRVICRDGTIEAGRPDCWIGAHVYGHNEISLGVCLIGCDSFTDAQYDSLEQVLREWQRDYPGAMICGHRDFSFTEKTCPNFDVAAWCRDRQLPLQKVVVA